jgi:hypothetical protein
MWTRAYFESIEDFKNTSCFKLVKKIQQKNIVRKNKREVRRAIRDLRDLHDVGGLICSSRRSLMHNSTRALTLPPPSPPTRLQSLQCRGHREMQPTGASKCLTGWIERNCIRYRWSQISRRILGFDNTQYHERHVQYRTLQQQKVVVKIGVPYRTLVNPSNRGKHQFLF